MTKKKPYLLAAFLLTASLLGADETVAAENTLAPNPPSYIPINLSYPAESRPIEIRISREQSLAYHWSAGKKITIQIYVEDRANQKRFLRDREGRRSWTMVIGQNLEASLTIRPVLSTYTGRLIFTAENMMILAPTPYLAETMGLTVEKVYEARFPDGAALRVHYTDQILEESGASAQFPKQVLDASVSAYQTITQYGGFRTEGYSLANPDESYAYDPDKTVDIYLGNTNEANQFLYHSFSSLSFRDAPCFDTVKLSETAYQSVILLPANYREFIQNWEHLNPSSLGARNTNVDLRGTLIHEMLHVILFYYNKNLSRENGETVNPVDPKKAPANKNHLDWYVEGLARYFETFAGARHDFYSQGFRETLPDKIRFSRGGSNYFMRYPDQPFMELRYENALFWRFIDHQFGMASIEKLSRSFRTDARSENFHLSLEKATGASFEDLLKRFAMAALLSDFGLKDDAKYLKEVARTRLLYKNGLFYLVDGYGGQKALGKTCRTDWIGRWDATKAKLGELPVAGDNTDACDVSGWATDFYEIAFDEARPELPRVRVVRESGAAKFLVQAVLRTKGGSLITEEWRDEGAGSGRTVSLKELTEREGLSQESIERAYLVITNLDEKKTANYEISASI